MSNHIVTAEVVSSFALYHLPRVISQCIRQMAEPAKRPVLLMMDSIIENLEAQPNNRNPAGLSREMQEAHDAVLPLLQPNVREHNWVRLTRVFNFFAHEDFLTVRRSEDRSALRCPCHLVLSFHCVAFSPRQRLRRR